MLLMAPRLPNFCLILAAAAILAPVTLSADEFIPLGWKRAKIKGVTYVSANGDLLPAGWYCEIVDNIATKASCSQGAALKANQVANIKVTTFGDLEISYKIKTTKTPSASGDAVLTATFIGSASAYVKSEKVGGEVSAAGKTSHFAEVVASTKVGGEIENYNGPKSRSIDVKASGNQWVTEADGQKSATITVKLPKLWASASAKNPTGGGGTWMALMASGSADVKLYPSKLTFRTFGPYTVGGNTHPFLEWICVDLFSTNNVPLNNHMANVVDGAALMNFENYAAGTYNLYVWARGSLRKKVQVFYDPALGLSGLDMTLKFGDLNGDNFVSAEEVAYIYGLIGTDIRESDAWYGDPFDGKPYRPAAADLDGDGFITAADHAMAAANQGLYGD